MELEEVGKDTYCGTVIPNVAADLHPYHMMPYEKFEAWRATHRLALEVYCVTSAWPPSERYQLTAQIRRAALSAPTNISRLRGKARYPRIPEVSGHLTRLAFRTVLLAQVQ